MSLGDGNPHGLYVFLRRGPEINHARNHIDGDNVALSLKGGIPFGIRISMSKPRCFLRRNQFFSVEAVENAILPSWSPSMLASVIQNGERCEDKEDKVLLR